MDLFYFDRAFEAMSNLWFFYDMGGSWVTGGGCSCLCFLCCLAFASRRSGIFLHLYIYGSGRIRICLWSRMSGLRPGVLCGRRGPLLFAGAPCPWRSSRNRKCCGGHVTSRCRRRLSACRCCLLWQSRPAPFVLTTFYVFPIWVLPASLFHFFLTFYFGFNEFGCFVCGFQVIANLII